MCSLHTLQYVKGSDEHETREDVVLQHSRALTLILPRLTRLNRLDVSLSQWPLY